MPILAALAPLASLLLGLNIAYLRLDRFQHRTKIRERARAGLADLFPGESTQADHKKSQHYQRLAYLAEEYEEDENGEQHERTDRAKHVHLKRLPRASGLVYSVVFKNERDRTAAVYMTWIALFTVVTGTLDAAGLVQFSESISEFPLAAALIAGLLVVMLVLSVSVVLAGDGYVSRALEVIDDDVRETGLVVADKPPKEPEPLEEFFARLGGAD